MMNGKPLMIDGFCGLGGASLGFLAEGWECVGFDNERHRYPELEFRSEVDDGSKAMSGRDSHGNTLLNSVHRTRVLDAMPTGRWKEYPGQLVLQDILTIHGSQFKDADFLWFSPPCQEFSYMAMPWSRAKQIRREYLDGTRDRADLTQLFDNCFRIQREACEAAGRHIPMIVENVRGAQEWVGRSAWHYGSFHLWGDVPALMPWTGARVVKREIQTWSDFGKPDYKAQAFNGLKLGGNNGPRRWEDREVQRLRDYRESSNDGATKIGGDWFSDPQSPSRKWGSKSNARKQASAQIAMIPLALSTHLARAFKPAV